MTAWLAGPFLAFDTETSGIDVENDRIVTACTALLRQATPNWTQDITSHLIAVDIDIPEEATAVHGITTKHARDHGRPAAEVLDLVAGDLARAMLARIPIVGANLAYDFTILDRELRRHNLPTVEERLDRLIAPVLDVYVLDKHLDPFRKGKRNLGALCEHYGVLHVGAHDSTGDALAAARVAYRMGLLAQTEPTDYDEDQPAPFPALARLLGHGQVALLYRELAAMSLDQLHAAQIGWRKTQCASLRAYFDQRGTKHDGIPGDWPLIPYARRQAEPAVQEALV